MRILFHFGRYTIMLSRLFRAPEKFSMYWKETVRQMDVIGTGSLGIVFMISAFIGAVTAVQTAFQFAGSFLPEYYIGFVVRDSMLLELAPTFTALVLAGKVGSSIASELGAMRVREHLDALKIMGVNTESYIIGPKLIAALATIPLLTILAAATGMAGGYFAGVITGALSPVEFEKGLQSWLTPYFINIMLVKSAVFAFLLTSIAAYQGFYVTDGTLGIGRASTRAVVYGCVFILLADLMLVLLLT